MNSSLKNNREISTHKRKRSEHKNYARLENISNLRFCARHLVHSSQDRVERSNHSAQFPSFLLVVIATLGYDVLENAATLGSWTQWSIR
jgi:hypothetical protein